MPRGNGTGPTGMGPMTGRGAGFCAGFETAGFANPAMGRGMGRGGMGLGLRQGFGGGRGAGRGMGMGRGYFPNGVVQAPPAAPAVPKQVLQEQLAALRANVDVIEQRLAQLDNEGGDSE